MQIQTFIDCDGNEHAIVVTPKPEDAVPVCFRCSSIYKIEVQVGSSNAQPCIICKQIQYRGNQWGYPEAVIDLIKDGEEVKTLLI